MTRRERAGRAGMLAAGVALVAACLPALARAQTVVKPGDTGRIEFLLTNEDFAESGGALAGAELPRRSRTMRAEHK